MKECKEPTQNPSIFNTIRESTFVPKIKEYSSKIKTKEEYEVYSQCKVNILDDHLF